jgi:methyl-accepting chemotaxis protein
MPRHHKFPLRLQVLCISLVGVVAFLLLGGFAAYNERSIEAARAAMTQARDANLLVTRAGLAFEAARGLGQRFIAERKPELAQAESAMMERALALLGAAEQAGGDGRTAGAIAELRRLVDVYRRDFAALRQTVAELGTAGAPGLEAALDAAGAALEERLDVLAMAGDEPSPAVSRMQLAVAQMRGAERDFRRTGDSAHAAGMMGPVGAFGEALEGAELAEAEGAALEAGLAGYRQAFRAFADVQVEMPNQVEQQRGQAVRLGDAMEALLAQYEAQAAALWAETEQITAWLEQATMAGLAVALVAMAGAGIAIGRLIARRVTRMVDAVEALAAGRRDVVLPTAGRVRDEMTDLAEATRVFREVLIENERMEAAAAAAAAQVQRQSRHEAMERHTAHFGESIALVLGRLGEASRGIDAAARQMHAQAARAGEAAGATAAEAQRVGSDLAAVAAAAEQLGASVNEITRQVGHASTQIGAATASVGATEREVGGLTTKAREIDAILGSITEIAARTSLLSLNATIEAARAGDAGRGFAVVAGEVKALAERSTRSAAEIGQRIDGVRKASGTAEAEMARLAGAIRGVEGVATQIAAAMEEQESATREIASTIQVVNQANATTTATLGEMARIARETGQQSSAVLATAQELVAVAGTLEAEVAQFLADMRGDEDEAADATEDAGKAGASLLLAA